MITAIIVVGSIFAYMMIGGALAGLLDDGDEYGIGALFIALWWPLCIPVLVAGITYSWVRNR